MRRKRGMREEEGRQGGQRKNETEFKSEGERFELTKINQFTCE